MRSTSLSPDSFPDLERTLMTATGAEITDIGHGVPDYLLRQR